MQIQACITHELETAPFLGFNLGRCVNCGAMFVNPADVDAVAIKGARS